MQAAVCSIPSSPAASPRCSAASRRARRSCHGRGSSIACLACRRPGVDRTAARPRPVATAGVGVMTVVFVHGVPETRCDLGAAPRRVRPGRRGDVVPARIRGAGSGAFVPTSDGYRDWLIGELEHSTGRSTSSATTGAPGTRSGRRRRDPIWCASSSPTSPGRPTARTSGTTWRRSGRPKVTGRHSSRRSPPCRSTNASRGSSTPGDPRRPAVVRRGRRRGDGPMHPGAVPIGRPAEDASSGVSSSPSSNDRPDTLVVIPLDDEYTGGPGDGATGRSEVGCRSRRARGPRTLVDDAGPGPGGCRAPNLPDQLTQRQGVDGCPTRFRYRFVPLPASSAAPRPARGASDRRRRS